jgi:hypothetical protein
MSKRTKPVKSETPTETPISSFGTIQNALTSLEDDETLRANFVELAELSHVLSIKNINDLKKCGVANIERLTQVHRRLFGLRDQSGIMDRILAIKSDPMPNDDQFI